MFYTDIWVLLRQFDSCAPQFDVSIRSQWHPLAEIIINELQAVS